MGRYKNPTGHYPYSRLYRIWLNMRCRCNTVTNPNYQEYGARRINVCEEWDAYEAFEIWALTHGYSDDLTLDRINNNKGYSPENCRWATAQQQANNRRSSKVYMLNNESHTAAEWARIKGMPYKSFMNRIYRGSSFEDAFNEPYLRER